MKIAIIQMRAGADKAQNILKALSFVEAAASHGATFILLPETFWYRGNATAAAIRKDIAEPVYGPSVQVFQRAAQQHACWILLGSIFEHQSQKKKAFNTSVFLSPQGKIVATYRKMHLFRADIGRVKIQETDIFIPGRRRACLNINGWTAGAAICYDLRFSSVFDFYGKKSCAIITVPSCFTYETGKDHWEILLRSRAIEHKCFVLAPNQCGADKRGIRAYGNSMVIDPWGKILARASLNHEEIIWATISQSAVVRARQRLPPSTKGFR